MATTPDTDVVDHLDTNVAALTRDTNLFMGKLRSGTAEAVFVLASGGPEPLAYLDGTTIERRFSDVQCMVRSDRGDFSGGQVLARSVRDNLHHQTLTGYIDVRVMQSEPIYVAEEKDEHHVWAVNVQLWHEQ